MAAFDDLSFLSVEGVYLFRRFLTPRPPGLSNLDNESTVAIVNSTIYLNLSISHYFYNQKDILYTSK
ncbi:hypothetical protein KDK_57170 [Dictyobacter kobayashii]|uniref:Uncharacterized protein n=1 Tax=Dictyobacter kobayashii TaxID=2014872 RepID=A0A402AS41_9CHLR|nr:hypothetical protein KDK_57170 [Dictyobacter kobayashii]